MNIEHWKIEIEYWKKKNWNWILKKEKRKYAAKNHKFYKPLCTYWFVKIWEINQNWWAEWINVINTAFVNKCRNFTKSLEIFK